MSRKPLTGINDMVTRNSKSTARKYVFVCGLQRSGTSVLARNIGRFTECTSFKNTGVPQDEGQYLQNVYLTDTQLGGNPRYGFDPRAHLTDQSRLLTAENIAKLHASWHAHWDPAKPICLEKTPGNLIMTRFLDAAFPNAYFVVVRRHPVPVAMANQRWRVSLSSLHYVFEHWLHCYGLFEEDKRYLERVYELRYEDYVKNPARYHQEIAEFIGASSTKERMEETSDVHNRKYLDRWVKLRTSSRFKAYYRYIAFKYHSRFSTYGYSLLTVADAEQQPSHPVEQVPLALGTLYCLLADTHALVWRSTARLQWYFKRQLRARLPASLKSRLKRLRRGDVSRNSVRPPA